ncbi:MAG: hypothetical protein LBT60_06305 [Oscillospiraceae bacterium]|nr:hypothetical protein [Oscillospiraceae bacterium]
MKEKGLVVISIEGMPGKASRAPARPAVPGWLAGAGGAALALTAALFFFYHGKQRQPGARGDAPAPAAPAATSMPGPAPGLPPAPAHEPSGTPPEEAGISAAAGRGMPPAPPAQTKAAEAREPGDDRRVLKKIPEGIRLSNAGATNRAETGYSSMTERIINMVVNTKPGYMPGPLLALPPDEDLEKVLNADIGIFDDDTDEKIGQKKNVAYVKERFKAYLAAGGEKDGFLADYHQGLVALAAERNDAQGHYYQLKKAGEDQAAALYFEEKNREYEGRGIAPLRAGKIERPK